MRGYKEESSNSVHFAVLRVEGCVGNLVTDTGRHGVLEYGKVTFPKPRYHYCPLPTAFCPLPSASTVFRRSPTAS